MNPSKRLLNTHATGTATLMARSGEMPSFSREAAQFFVQHIFLPPQLPQQDDSDPASEDSLLELVASALGEYAGFVAEDVRPVVAGVRQAISELLKVRGPAGNIDDDQLLAALRKVETEPNITVPLYVATQNAGVIMSKHTDHVLFEVFELLPLNHASMSTSGRLRRYFPGQALAIKPEIFKDAGFQKALAQALAKMSFQLAAAMIPKVKKAGQEQGESNDTTHPGLVTELLTAFLRPLSSPVEIARLLKNTRDEVLWQGGKPWHRSPLWLLIRVVMGIQFARRGGHDETGRRRYKLFMVFLMASALEIALDRGSSFSPDMLFCMSAKISRRLLKLGSWESEPGTGRVKDALNRAKGFLEKHWSAVIAQSAPLDLGRLRTLAFKKDVHLSLPELDSFIDSIAARKPAQESTDFRPAASLQVCSATTAPRDILFVSNDYSRYNLASFEEWVPEHLASWLSDNIHREGTVEELRALMARYRDAAWADYKDNPESVSKMILVVLELWVACDKAATTHLPMLRDYDHKIPLKPLQYLLLPLKEGMARLLAVENHLCTRSSGKSRHGSILQDFGTKDCFAVRYFDKSGQHQSLMDRISAAAEKEREEKLQELEEKKRLYASLSQQYHQSECQFVRVWSPYVRDYVPKHDKSDCQKCRYGKEMSSISITAHEWPLPDRPLEARSVVFELDVPPAFSAWRQATVFILADVFGYEYVQTGQTQPDKLHSLKTYKALSRYFQNTPAERDAQWLELASQTTPNSHVHRNTHKITTADQSSVCVKNGMRYSYHDPVRKTFVTDFNPTEFVKEMCTYKLPAAASSLQTFLTRSFDGATDETPNCVIASQHKCPPHMSLMEYRALASLPVGHRIQWENILVQMACPSVDLKKLETSLFVLQVIYQAGPRADETEANRAGHDILHQERFCHKLLGSIEESSMRMKKNWESIQALGTFIVIAARVLSFAPPGTTSTMATRVLAKLREISFDWMKQLQDKCYETDDDMQRAEFSSKTMEIALVCCGTYDVDQHHLEELLRDAMAASAFIQCSITIQECSPRVATEAGDGLVPILRRRWQSLSQRLYPIIRDQVISSDDPSTCLDDAIAKAWPKYKRQSGRRWQVPTSDTDHWVTTRTEPDPDMGRGLRVHYNILTGELLVNGLPLSRLPSEYERHEAYRRLFGIFAFQVIPCAKPGIPFSSKRPYQGHAVHFGLSSQDLLCLAEPDTDNVTLHLIPFRVFRDRLPVAFVDDYVHWYNPSSGTVEFRPIGNPWTRDPKTSYTLARTCSADWVLTGEGGTSLVNPASETGREISTILSPLRAPLRIHMFLTADSQTLNVGLVGLQLAFFLKQGECELQSRQFRGMRIDADQYAGTLVGLGNKLVLRSRSGIQDRIVLIPPGGISCEKEGGHVRVSISLDPGPAHTTPHAYRLDQRLGRLVDKGSLQSKLLLAHLHALTSFCLPDHFTQSTGTEMALTILASAAVRSFDHLTQENMDTLARLAELTPTRCYYPRHEQDMQTVKWSDRIGFLAQSGHFYSTVSGLFRQSLDADMYRPKPVIDLPKLGEMNEFLLRRDLSRTSTFNISAADDYLPPAECDMEYAARDLGTSSPRVERTNEVAALLFRQSPCLSRRPEADLASRLWQSLLTASEPLEGPGETLGAGSFDYDSHWLGEDQAAQLAMLWCRLHAQANCSRVDPPFNKFQLMMWLATVSFAERANMDVVLAIAGLFTVPALATAAALPPAMEKFGLEDGPEPCPSWLKVKLAGFKIDFWDCSESQLQPLVSETAEETRSRRRSEWQSNRDKAIGSLVKHICDQFPSQAALGPKGETEAVIRRYVKVEEAVRAINPRFRSWYNNSCLKSYLETTARILRQQHVEPLTLALPARSVESKSEIGRRMEVRRYVTTQDLFDIPAPVSVHASAPTLDILAPSQASANGTKSSTPLRDLIDGEEHRANTTFESRYARDLRRSLDELLQARSQEDRICLDKQALQDVLRQHLNNCEGRVARLLDEARRAILDAGGNGSRAFLLSLYLTPQISPTFLLRQLARARGRWESLPSDWKSAIVQYGIALTGVQRAERLVRALDGSPNYQDLIKEATNAGHTNWRPFDYPDSLLLEVESGIMIREVQEAIADEMRRQPAQGNAVMQLMMGEGKTSVIVPIVAAALASPVADGPPLVRIMVAKPQRKQMEQVLVSKLGGLVDRQIFHMPVSRSLELSHAEAERIAATCRRCAEEGGIMLVQPEHVLSFKLMGLECLIGGKQELGRSLMKTQHYLDTTTRDIVDESDENFSVKFELIYTMGAPGPVDFAPDRWTVVQAVLELVRQLAPEVRDRMPQGIEVHDAAEGAFPRTRLLKKDAEAALFGLMATHICDKGLSGFPVHDQKPVVRDAVRKYISKRQLADAEIASVENGPFWTETTQGPLLLLRGLLAGGVLGFVLGEKRWRVNYGLDDTRKPMTKLAVPFRAKDSPTPRSEFSHPDVIISLTCLSYYYGGLKDEDLFLAFGHLVNSDQAMPEYGEWVRDAPALPQAFRQLQGVNLKDAAQCKTSVFPPLRHAKGVIDYFLSHIVFSRHMKEFPQKLSASGWDLGAAKPYPTTGFSGTVDSQVVLPLDMHFRDLAEQKHTNALVLGYLLQEENTVFPLPSRDPAGDARTTTDADALLAAVVAMDRPVRVILDVGAQIIELTNFEVVHKWLDMTTEARNDVHAAIFFDDNEDMQVLDRHGHVEPLQISPFMDRLDQCVVFLDESHTRGTDLKLPGDYRAAVTLGVKVTKDRLVQACMRMRKLGKGQSVVFCLPEEINTTIRERGGRQPDEPIGVADVLSWAIAETHADLKRTVPLWAAQGRRFDHQSALWEAHADDDYQIPADRASSFLEMEALSLDDRYRPGRTPHPDGARNESSRSRLIEERCSQFGSMNVDSSALQEEQERELSPEKEKERQEERPPPADPKKHELHGDMRHFATTGDLPAKSSWFLPAFQSLHNTSATKHLDPVQFPCDLLVTRDFADTLDPGQHHACADSHLDAFQRPVQWILTSSSGPDKAMVAVIISPFEANELLPLIKEKANTTLHLYSPTPSRDIRPLDGLDLYTVPALPADWVCPPRTLINQLNLFSGQLYFGSFSEYKSMCDMLGLSCQAPLDNVDVAADGFIMSGRGACTFDKSPVRFLREFLTRVRKDCQPIDKTHFGKLLKRDPFGESDFGDTG